jgi:hydrogenase-4 component E
VTALASLLAFLALLMALLVVWRQSWPGRLRLFVLQSVALALLAAVIGLFAGKPSLLAGALVFAVLKARIIPDALRRIARGLPVRPVAPGRSAGLRLLAAAGLVIAAYVVMLPVTATATVRTAGAVPLAFAAALIGLLVLVTGRDAFGHILGFLLFENGIFAVALVAAWGLPGLVEAGVFLDVLVIVLIMEGVVVELRREHETIEVDLLKELRG